MLKTGTYIVTHISNQKKLTSKTRANLENI